MLIVYDADQIRHPDSHLFEPRYWEEQGAVTGHATGRGSTLFLETEFGHAVLRQYLRGGWSARVSRDRYVFSGFEQSRPVKEYQVLEALSVAGLPVPEPLAAICVRDGRLYSGWLMTRRIMHSVPLADVIGSRRDTPDLWRETGACIRRFHDFGLVHADLNARNILVAEDGIHLIDFDQARFRPGEPVNGEGNLNRLKRSLVKLWPAGKKPALQTAWTALKVAYDE